MECGEHIFIIFLLPAKKFSSGMKQQSRRSGSQQLWKTTSLQSLPHHSTYYFTLLLNDYTNGCRLILHRKEIINAESCACRYAVTHRNTAVDYFMWADRQQTPSFSPSARGAALPSVLHQQKETLQFFVRGFT